MVRQESQKKCKELLDENIKLKDFEQLLDQAKAEKKKLESVLKDFETSINEKNSKLEGKEKEVAEVKAQKAAADQRIDSIRLETKEMVVLKD